MLSPKDKRKKRYVSLIYFLEKPTMTSGSTEGESTGRAQSRKREGILRFVGICTRESVP